MQEATEDGRGDEIGAGWDAAELAVRDGGETDKRMLIQKSYR
jgi:hypothetical protein